MYVLTKQYLFPWTFVTASDSCPINANWARHTQKYDRYEISHIMLIKSRLLVIRTPLMHKGLNFNESLSEHFGLCLRTIKIKQLAVVTHIHEGLVVYLVSSDN